MKMRKKVSIDVSHKEHRILDSAKKIFRKYGYKAELHSIRKRRRK